MSETMTGLSGLIHQNTTHHAVLLDSVHLSEVGPLGHNTACNIDFSFAVCNHTCYQCFSHAHTPVTQTSSFSEGLYNMISTDVEQLAASWTSS